MKNDIKDMQQLNGRIITGGDIVLLNKKLFWGEKRYFESVKCINILVINNSLIATICTTWGDTHEFDLAEWELLI